MTKPFLTRQAGLGGKFHCPEKVPEVIDSIVMPIPLLPNLDQRSVHNFKHLHDASTIDGLSVEAFDPQLRADARVQQEKFSGYMPYTWPRDNFNPLLGLICIWDIDLQRSSGSLTIIGV